MGGVLIVGIGVALAVAGLVLVLVVGDVITGDDDRALDCGDYAFDRDAWFGGDAPGDDAKPNEAEALVRCETLIGMNRTEVVAMLGHPGGGSLRNRRTWNYDAGWVNDEYGPGDGQAFRVRLDRAGRVVRTSLLYAPDWRAPFDTLS